MATYNVILKSEKVGTLLLAATALHFSTAMQMAETAANSGEHAKYGPWTATDFTRI